VAFIASVIALVLAAVLTVAGTIKLVHPDVAAKAMRRISARLLDVDARRARIAGRAVGTVEVAVALMLVLPGAFAVAGAVAAVGLFACFLVVTVMAVRRGAACGCWGSLSDGPAGVHEVRRRVYFLVAAIGLASIRLACGPPEPPALVVAASMLALGVLAVSSAGLAWRSSRTRSTPGVRLVRGAERRRLRDVLRNDPAVVAMVEEIDPDARLDWPRIRASRKTDAPSTLVAVPGEGVNLRVVVVNDEAVTVIGETKDVVVFRADGVVHHRRPRAVSARLR
jgi:hypothetical protein